jgi:hypothetical protein
MQALIKVGDNLAEGVLVERHGLSPSAAIDRFKYELLRRRLVLTAAEAEVRYTELQGRLWLDGDVVETRDVWRKPAGEELRVFLFINIPGLPDPTLAASRYSRENIWDDKSLWETLGRSSYRFRYWDYLTSEQLAKVRNQSIVYQPFLYRYFAVAQLEKL